MPRRTSPPADVGAQQERLSRIVGEGSARGWVPAVDAPAAAFTAPVAPVAPVAPAAGPAELPPIEPDLGAAVRAVLAARLPAAVRGGLVAPGRRAVVGLGLLGLLAAALAGWLALRSGGHPVAADEPLPASSYAPGPALGQGAAAVTPGGELVVDVAGRVRRPGVVHVPAGSRVQDALAAAGGVLSGVDLTSVDRARKLVDGEQVRIGLPPIASGAPGGATAPGGGSGGPVDLNTADATQFEALPGVGPVLAQRIIAWRAAHGGFTSVAQLRQVQGLSGRTGEQLMALVTAG